MQALDIPIQNIVVRMPNWLGDAVMATPVLEDLRNFFPSANLTIACQSHIIPLLEHNPFISKIHPLVKASSIWEKLYSIPNIHFLRNGHFDLGVLLTNSFTTAWELYLGGVKKRLGYRDYFRGSLLNIPVSYPENKESQHLVLTYKHLIEQAGIPTSDSEPQVFIGNEAKKEAKQILNTLNIPDNATLIAVNPGAAYGPAKCWLPERFVALNTKFRQRDDVYLLYFGDQGTSNLVNGICSDSQKNIFNLCGKTSLRQFIALLNECHVMLTNDSGPMHLAAALKIPLLALFGSTSDIKTGPYGKATIIHKRVSCSPCYKRECPIDFRCMTSISVEEVHEKLLILIEEGDPRSRFC